ncbi:MAG: two-component regulator propeller domain-containing protein [Bacteroidota bacterium]
MLKRVTYIFSFWLVAFASIGQTTQPLGSSILPNFQFETLDMPGIESGSSTQTIAQDSFGFMWFGKQDGLYRWDGYVFDEYLEDITDSTSLASNYVEYIYVTRDSTVWIGTLGGGLDRFDYTTETFTHYTHDPADPTTISDDLVFDILEDKEGYLWVTTHNGINRLDVSTGKFKRFNHDPNDPNSLTYSSCGSVFQDSEGTLWFGCGFAWGGSTEGGLNRYRPETEDFVRYQHDPNDPTSLISSKVHDVFEDSKGNFWVGTSGDGVHLMDRKSGTFQRIENNISNPLPYSGPFRELQGDSHVRVFFEDNKGRLWIGTWSGGLKYYDLESGKFQTFFMDEENPSSFPENNCWTIMQTRDGTIWGTTTSTSPEVFKIRESAVHLSYATGPDVVTGIGESRNSELWVGTSAGLRKFDPITQNEEFFDQSNFLPPVVFPEGKEIDLLNFNLCNTILQVLEDDERWLYITAKSFIQDQLTGGLIKLNPNSGEVIIYTHSSEVNNSIGEYSVLDILRDNQDRIWAATTSGDLNLLNKDDHTFERFFFRDFEEYPNPDFDVILELSSDGGIWVGYKETAIEKHPVTIKKFNPDTKTFLDYKITAPFSNEKNNYELLRSIQEDDAGNLWISTETAIKKINPELYKGGSAPIELHSSDVEILAEDIGARMFGNFFFENADRIWILGDGLYVYDLNPENINASYSDGIVIDDLPHNELFKASNGLIYIIEPDGITAFYPERLGEFINVSLPETHITDFKVLKKQSESDEIKPVFGEALTVSDIKLNYDQNAFSFTFAALHFNNSDLNQHQFKLEGYDDDWRMAGLDREATYVKVAPGKYTFRVRGATNVSKWSPERTVVVRIFPPWWATWWAYTLYSLGVLGLLYFFYQTQLSKQLQKAETQRLKELDNVKTRLYTNITHEFRTPLTVILGMARQVIKQPETHLDDGMKMIVRNGENLLSLVNQMLDLSKLESGKLKLNAEHGDIIAYLNYLIESFHSFAESKDIKIHFLSEAEAIFMDYDPQKIQQIVTNLISNAVKFTPEGGHIYCSIHSEKAKSEKETGTIILKVRDTGVGIPEDELPFIFDRFYQVDNSMKRSEEGTGIGLALTKELIKLMEGSIEVWSKVGQGTTFEITLPIYHDAKESPTPVIPKEINADNYQLQNDHAGNGVESAIKNGVDGDSKKPLLLIAEDNKDVVQYLAFCLAEDYRLAVAKDGREGIDIALEITPDIIITDVMMPNVDGFELATTLKNDERTSHIPIIMLTAKADVESKLEGLDKGVDAYLAKPFHKEELLLRVRKLLELRSNLRQWYLSVLGTTSGNGHVNPLEQEGIKAALEDQFVEKVKKNVESHIDDFDFTMDKFCKEVGLSHSQLHRKLVALTGLSATKFIRYIRLNKAKDLLLDPDMTITAVAFDTGFNDPGYFGRIFKKEFGMTPGEWQKSAMLPPAN